MTAAPAELVELLRAQPLPGVDGGKSARANLVIVGGSPSCPGSAILAGRAALRAGAGRVQLVVHPDVAAAVGAAFPEALVVGWDHEGAPSRAVADTVAGAGTVIVGPGLMDCDAAAAAVAVSEHLDGALVVDARAMPAVAHPALEQHPVVAAPNLEEARRLLGDRQPEGDDADDDAELAALAQRVSELVGGPAAHRGGTSVLDDGEGGQWQQVSPSPGLGTPGSGDVLMGALGAFLVRGAPAAAALGWAIAAHARAGAILAQAHPIGFLAREVADALPAALGELEAELA